MTPNAAGFTGMAFIRKFTARRFSKTFRTKSLEFCDNEEEWGIGNRRPVRQVRDDYVSTQYGPDREDIMIAAAMVLLLGLTCGSGSASTGNFNWQLRPLASFGMLSKASGGFERSGAGEKPPYSQAQGTAPAQYLGAWPRLMSASAAAAYVGERSVGSFRRSTGKLWPAPLKVPGKGDRWLKEELDEAIDRLSRRPHLVRDAADVL